MVTMPPGSGKSRVIALVTSMLISDFDGTRIIYNDRDLKQFEQPTINMLAKSLAPIDQAKLSVGVIGSRNSNIVVADNHLCIVDEADNVFLDHRIQINGSGSMIALTATCSDDMNQVELSYLRDHCKFEFLFSGMSHIDKN